MNKFVLILAMIFCVDFANAYSLQYHPFLLQTKDKNGETLVKVLDKFYGDKITVKKGRCTFFEKQRNAGDIEYEIDKCRIDYSQEKVYTQADRLNGIEVKGQIWVEGDSYRTRVVGRNWSEWKSTEFLPGLKWYFRTGTEFSKQNGEFVFNPTNGLKNLRGEIKYMSKHRTEEINNGQAPGIIIQESESGNIVIQESR